MSLGIVFLYENATLERISSHCDARLSVYYEYRNGINSFLHDNELRDKRGKGKML